MLEDVLGAAHGEIKNQVNETDGIDAASIAIDQRIDIMLADDVEDLDLVKELEDITSAGETARQIEDDDKAMRAAMKQKAGNGGKQNN